MSLFLLNLILLLREDQETGGLGRGGGDFKAVTWRQDLKQKTCVCVWGRGGDCCLLSYYSRQTILFCTHPGAAHLG